ncbi:C-X-C chemokine receptor type 6-like [Narcine bancroftii]|uniref:C-X-C chemokine receptor type 6-like n=1 Tax=Narcine bancroftii TaxID=1343680 RepID=UPI003831D03D
MTDDEYYNYYYDENSTLAPDYYTFCNNSKIRDFTAVYMPSLYAIIFLAGLLGNSLVIVTKVFYEKLKTMTDVYMMNLAIADLIFICTLPIWAIDAYNGWIFGNLMCKIVKGVYTVNFYSSMFILTCVTINRYHAIVQATKMTKNKRIYSVFICTWIWMLAIIMALPEILLSKTSADEFGIIVCNMNYPPNSSNIIKAGVHLMQMVVGFLIPFMTMIFCYTIIAKSLLQAKGFQKSKSLKIIVAVVTVFIICNLPFNISLLLQTMQTVSEESTRCEYNANIIYAIIVTESIAYVHCCLNPILYVFLGVKFRNNFWKILKDIGCISQKQLNGYLKIEYKTSQQRSCVSETTMSSLKHF